jgi:thiol-disulfide isomerase/thioredoxin
MDKAQIVSALRSRPIGSFLAGLFLAAGIATLSLALYRMDAGKSNASGECAASRPLAQRLLPLARGEVAALGVLSTPHLLPSLRFEDSDGKMRELADFKGQAVLVNLWATWCVPCRKEMPALDRLQGELGGRDFAVVAVNIDTTRLDNRRRFLEEAGIHRLAFYADPKAEIFQILKGTGTTIGLPTTLLIDKAGCQVASLAGPAEWASPDAVELIRALIGS